MTIMYVCDECQEHAPEGCGHNDRTELRVMPDGEWLCESCYDENFLAVFDENDEEIHRARWADLPVPPEYLPVKP